MSKLRVPHRADTTEITELVAKLGDAKDVKVRCGGTSKENVASGADQGVFSLADFVCQMAVNLKEQLCELIWRIICQYINDAALYGIEYLLNKILGDNKLLSPLMTAIREFLMEKMNAILL